VRAQVALDQLKSAETVSSERGRLSLDELMGQSVYYSVLGDVGISV
jgi:hypothetical protein